VEENNMSQEKNLRDEIKEALTRDVQKDALEFLELILKLTHHNK